jgi:predicted nucleic acid-binding protein
MNGACRSGSLAVLLVDTSVWILVDIRPDAIAGYIEDEEDLAICPVILQEVLQGAHPGRYRRLRDALSTLEMLDAPVPLERYEEAAQLYRRCRDAGFTIRKSTDCLIAATALHHDATVLHHDNDFDHIARVLPLRVMRV